MGRPVGFRSFSREFHGSMRKILGRRNHILNDPLYLFLQHVAGMGNTRVEALYETDEGNRAERIQTLYDNLSRTPGSAEINKTS